jgi:orotidine-5'-phosphate decarboxylase
MHSVMKFIDKLVDSSRRNNSLLCIGLDPDPQQMPAMSLLQFTRAIIEATSDLVCAYKPNFAFFEAQGIDGMHALVDTIKSIPSHIPVIADAKRGDIGNTARAYAIAVFERLGCDAVTVSPYLGFDSVQPFLEYEDRGVFILCRTSNRGAADFQDISDSGGRPLFEAVALKASEWNSKNNIGLVVGATYPQELQRIRKLCPNMMLLIPGVGTQGGDLELAVKYGVDTAGEKAIINVSRQVLYASRGAEFGSAARREALKLRNAINSIRMGK